MNTPVNVRAAPSTSAYPLISKERMQKLDLLKHLIANLANVVVVCGPDGIGKSRLLKLFQEDYAQAVGVSLVSGDSKLHFDQLKESLSGTINEVSPDLKAQPLSIALERINSRGGTVVQIIDDAGHLIPGLIGKIIEYANVHPALRVVLALSHNELYIKSATDPALEDCYQIEIPPLSQQQCEDYLEYLSTLANPRIDFNTISEERVAQVFSETHGIPGKILSYLPQPVVKKTLDYSNPILLSAVAALVLIVAGVQWWSNRPVAERKIDQVAAQPIQSDENKAPASPKAAATANPNDTLAAAESPITQPENAPKATPPALATAGQAASGGIAPDSQLPAGPKDQIAAGANASPSTQEPLPNNAAAESGVNNSTISWVNTQSPENLTLQLMALPNEQDIVAVIDRHPELKTGLRYVKTKTRRGGDRFILFYGSFSDQEQLNTEKQNLPKELKQVWIRKLADIQKQINSTTETPTQAQ